ncbi:MAG: GGDEF domain-containing protein [Aquabacterium sp.]|nr:MAG: GGDEF domain-containing protein [Aquabacterium sp.]
MRSTQPRKAAATAPRPRRPCRTGRAHERAGLLPSAHPEARSAQGRPMRRLSDLLLGTEPLLRTRMRFVLLAMLLYLCWILMHGYCIAQGYFSMPAAIPWVMAYDCIGMLAFYPLVRSGLTARQSDPALILPQILYGSVAAALSYALIPQLRMPLLQLLCLILMFGLFNLRPGRLLFAGCFAIGTLWAMYLVMAATGAPHFDPHREAINLAMASIILALLTAISRHHSRMRGRLREQKQQLLQTADQVRLLATQDPLTGLPNRQHLQELIERECKRLERSGQPFSLALADLDHFKRINDRHGHANGDEVLRNFAAAACAVLRETDMIGRWGGEEFLVLMPETTLPAATNGLERLRAHLARKPMVHALPELSVTFSAGISVHRLGGDLERTLERADRALYAAKAGGRDRTVGDDAPEPGRLSARA